MFFTKEPSKQNIYEKTAFFYLKNFFPNIKKLGINQLFISGSIENRGEVVPDRKLYTTSKSIDGCLEINGKKYFLCLKYTKDKGGSQDEQRNDAITFLDYASSNKEDDEYFTVICGGNYWDNGQRERLNSNFGSKKCFASSIENFVDYINGN
jgi:hypothetical protein